MSRLRCLIPMLSLLFALISPRALAGIWGQENWGEMYWGTNARSAPNAPTIASIVADGSDLVVTLDGYAPGADGWSVVTGYTITCGQTPPVQTTDNSVRITGLDSETQYSCGITATNAVGDSPQTIQLATTEAELQGLNLFLIYQALCDGANPPASCSN